MIVWRKLTVITFHVLPSKVPTANNTATRGHHDDSPTNNCITAMDPRVIDRQVPLPNFFDIHGAA